MYSITDKTYNTINPLNFVSWLELQDNISTDVNENLKRYQDYVKSWSKANKNSKIDEKSTITSLYVDLIKEITINFSSEEEKRFIVNFNYNDTDNLDIIIPFFVQKVKSICLYYSLKRESLKEKYSALRYKGTNLSVSKFVKNIIVSNIESGFSQKILEGRTTLPSLSAVNLFLDVKVEELYDTKNYFDNSNDTIRNNILSYDKIKVSPDIYLSFTDAIKDAINKYPLYASSLIGHLSFNLNLSGTELSYLKERDFLNYIITENNEDLKLNLLKRLAPKYSSCNFYYLSTGSTISEFSSGTLFNVKDYDGQPTQQLLNKNNINIASVQSLDNLYSSYELGKFFTPDKQGVVRYNTFNKFFFLNKEKLSPNSVYVFPDPDVIESDEDINGAFPLTYKIDVSWNKIGKQEGFRFGDVISDRHFQLFYPYQSYSQELNTQPLGLSVATDNVNFWSDTEASIWKSENGLWSSIDKVEKLPIQNRTDTLLFDKGIVTQWFVDLYGNQFALYKNLPEEYTLHDKNIAYGGQIYVKETQTGLVSSFKHFFNSLYTKYPDKVLRELDSSIYSLYAIKNTLVIETSSYVLIDSYTYDIDELKFKNTVLPGVFVPKYNINKNLEKYINSFYVEEEKNLYVCFLKLLPTLSASNYKSLYPVVYRVNIDDTNVEQIYPTANFDTTIYSLSNNAFSNYAEVDLRRIEGGKFSYKQKFGAFNLTYYAYNLNDIPFIINEQFSIAAGKDKLYSYIPTLHKPYYYVRDINFSNPNFDLSLRHGASYSEQIGYKDLETFNYTLDKNINDKFHFSSNIGPVFINVPGTHFVQFDWNSYVFGNVYFGCESVGVAKLDEFNLIDLRDNNPAIILTSEDTLYKIKDYKFNNKIYSVSAYRPTNSNGSIVTFVVEPSGFNYDNNEVFCTDLISTFKKVKVNLKGNGTGKVIGLPACLDCGDLCEFYFPKFSSITLIPSAARDNVFSGWIGVPCQGLASNCIATITDTTELTAIFNKTPEYTVTLKSNLPGVIPKFTNSTNLSCNDIACSSVYKENEVASVSADVIVGYVIDRFLGSDCVGTYDCNINVTNNLTVTAMYLSGAYSVEIYNIGVDSNSRNVGTVFCSLTTDSPITSYFKKVLDVNTNVTISATPFDNYRFVKFAGSPCQATGFNFCNFNVTKNYSISAIFNYPLFTVNTILSGNGLYYLESSTSRENKEKINIGTRNLQNTRNKSTAVFLSGEKVTLTAFGSQMTSTVFSEINYLSAYGYDVRIINDLTREITIPNITTNITITALSIVDEYNFIVEKVGTDTAKFQRVTVQINGGAVDTIAPGLSSKSYVVSPGDTILITPVFTPGFSDELLYVIGSNDLTYEYSSDSAFLLIDLNTPSSSIARVRINDLIETRDSIGSPTTPFTLNTYSTPIYNSPGSVNLINIDNYAAVTFIPTSDDQTIQVVYGRADYLAREEDPESPILTQGDYSNVPLII